MLAGFSGCAPRDPAHPEFVVARGKGFKITRAEWESGWHDVKPNENKVTDEDAGKQEVLERLIQLRLLEARAKQKKVLESLKVEAVTYVAQAKKRGGGEEAFARHLQITGMTEEKMRQNYLQQRLYEAAKSSLQAESKDVSEEALQQFYEENKGLWTRPSRMAVRMVTLPRSYAGNANATELMENVAAKLEADTPLREMQQRIADLKVREMKAFEATVGLSVQSPEFRKALLECQVGKTTRVIRDDRGWRVALLLEKGEEEVIPIEKVRAQVAHRLRQNIVSEKQRVFWEVLWDEADVRVFIGDGERSS